MTGGSLFTIGYAGFGNDVASFIDILKRYNINVLIDVRSMPHSGYFSQYDKGNLDKELMKHDIYYRNYASEFGARQEDRSLYPNGYMDFELFSKTSAFISGINKIEQSVAQNYKVVFMCAEKDPITCHRAILVSKAFSNRGHTITHILSDGSTKTQKDIEDELTKIHPRSLFDDLGADDIELAYRKQNAVIGYKLEDLL